MRGRANRPEGKPPRPARRYSKSSGSRLATRRRAFRRCRLIKHTPPGRFAPMPSRWRARKELAAALAGRYGLDARGYAP